MKDAEQVKKGLECCMASTNDDPFQRCSECPYNDISISVQECRAVLSADALEQLKEQEKKWTTLHKKHVITWRRNDEFSMRTLYEAICETLLDEGELFIARTDNHEKVDFVFYVAEGR